MQSFRLRGRRRGVKRGPGHKSRTGSVMAASARATHAHRAKTYLRPHGRCSFFTHDVHLAARRRAAGRSWRSSVADASPPRLEVAMWIAFFRTVQSVTFACSRTVALRPGRSRRARHTLQPTWDCASPRLFGTLGPVVRRSTRVDIAHLARATRGGGHLGDDPVRDQLPGPRLEPVREA